MYKYIYTNLLKKNTSESQFRILSLCDDSSFNLLMIFMTDLK